MLGSYELMAKVSITQKQLSTLSRQLYGKEKVSLKIDSLPDKIQGGAISSDNYLKRDLIKIGLFSTTAVVLQLLIFTLIKNNLLKISF